MVKKSKNHMMASMTLSRGILFLYKEMSTEREINSSLLKHLFSIAVGYVYSSMMIAICGLGWIVFLTAQGDPIVGEKMFAIRSSLSLSLIIPLIYLSGVVHEFGHALAAWAEGLNIEKCGLMFFIIAPLGFFVQISEDELSEAPVPSQMRVFSAGIFANLSLVCAALIPLWLAESTSLLIMIESLTQTAAQLGHPFWMQLCWAAVVSNLVIVSFNILPLPAHDGGHLLRLISHQTIHVSKREAIDYQLALLILPALAFSLFAGYFI